MTRIGKVFVAALLVVPAAAQAQRPSATVQTRSAELYLQTAMKQQVPADKQKAFKQALDAAVLGVQKDPGNSKTWFTLGTIYAEMGDAAGADSAFTKAETMWPDYKKDTDIERHRAYVSAFNAGVVAIQQNKLEDAIRNLEAAKHVYPHSPTASLNLANLYARANQADKAAQEYRDALAIMRGPEKANLKPEEVKQWATWEEAASYNLAQILAMSDKNEDAAQAYLDFLKTHPDNVTAESNLAVVYNRMGKKAEAQKIYTQLLTQDLSDEDFFAVGVGLFRGDQYGPAAEAFRKAIAKNPSNRDAYFNLAQALYSQIQPLEEQRSKAATPAAKKPLDTQLLPLYQELISASEKARDLDPQNRNVMALLARGYRGMSDVVPAAQANDWKNKTLAVMTTHQGLAFDVEDVTITPGTAEFKITGNVVGAEKATPGAPVKLTFSLLGKDGTVLGTQDVTVSNPKDQDAVPFTVTFKYDKPIGGWKYTVSK